MDALDRHGLQAQIARSLAADGRSLEALKRAAARDPQAALKGAAQQFEALFLQMVLKSMREATMKSGLLDSPAQETFTALLDQQLANRLATGGTGLAAVVERQLARAAGVGAAAAGTAGARAPAVGPRLSAAGETPRPDRTQPGGSRAEPAAGAGQARAAEPAPPAESSSSADGAKRAFASRLWDHALAAQQATGVPARFILAQAALESGWGQREIRGADGTPSYNLFGIKAGANWSGRTVAVTTTEYEGGVAKKVVQKFRAYNNYTEAFRDWARLMKDNPRYAGALGNRDAAGFAQALQRGGYATDPDYATKLARTIEAMAALRLS
ncbi:MAG: flagellar assembly peptidoglycan hydrolase FlgJ [Sutterellaceae bacterium]|nr:flagellar assembly peptidoglycan hydrolase FlgJ [Burkholderiaceae bacterium]MDW8429980.1 flagellar assembly peptidoglycan hydrolase FlgJ [Sutterellaceae bacterium]